MPTVHDEAPQALEPSTHNSKAGRGFPQGLHGALRLFGFGPVGEFMLLRVSRQKGLETL